MGDAFPPRPRHPRPRVVDGADSAPPAQPPAAPPPPDVKRIQQADRPEMRPADHLGYFDQLARAESRRRIRASAGYTYLSEVVAESADSSLHRWDDRAARPVRVYLPPGTVANFQPAFLDAVRNAFER